MTEINRSTVLVTGAAKGMGRRMARRFGQEGAELVLVDLDEENLEGVRKSLSTDGVTVSTFVCDLSERENINELHEDVQDEVGSIDILVNNAGIVQGGKYDEVSDEQDELTLDVNVEAVHWMTKRFLSDLEESEDSHLVQMASAAGMIGVPDQVVYSASKWFVIGLSRALRQELQSYDQDHVSMTIVSPGLVDTGMFEGAEPPMMMPTLEPEYMVDKIIEGVKNDKLFVREPFLVKLLPFMKGLMPINLVDFALEKLGARDLMQNWTGRH
jgi:short-subunit dehydrogenase